MKHFNLFLVSFFLALLIITISCISKREKISIITGDNRLFPGNYNLKLIINPEGNRNPGDRILIRLKDDSGKTINVQEQFDVSNSSVTVPFEIDKSLLHISLKTEGKKVKLSGFLIAKADSK